jgi:hypothetical protein
MKPFLITARTELVSITFRAKAMSSAAAAIHTAGMLGKLLGGLPFGITVTKLCEAQHG